MRNIVLITWDSVRANHCGCYKYKRNTTPFLSKAAKDGLKFENAIVSGLATPTSIVGAFTGDYPILNTNNIFRNIWYTILKEKLTFTQILLKNKYNTYGIISNPFLSRYFGFNKGFMYYWDVLQHDNSRDIKIPSIIPEGLENTLKKVWRLLKCDPGYPKAEELLDVLTSIKLKEPFFIWIFFTDPHHPYVPPKEYAKWGKYGGRRLLWLSYKMRKNPSKIKHKEREMLINSYDGEILHADSIVSQMWNYLENYDPIFIIHADHGEAFGEHGFYGHPPEHYEYLIRVPLIIYNADVKGVIKKPVSLLRLASTVCELADIENKFGTPNLLDDKYSPPVVINKIRSGFRITIRDDEWKLILNPDRTDELYNIKKDPFEQDNLIRQELDVEKDLRNRLKKVKLKILEKRLLKKKVNKLKKKL